MNEAWLVPIVILAIPAFIGTVVFTHARDLARMMIEPFKYDPDYRASGRGFMGFEVRSRRAPVMVLVQSDRTGTTERSWVITVNGLRLARRTTLEAAPKSVVSTFAHLVGVYDVEIGLEGFDRMMRLRGSDADVVRGVVSQPVVQAALEPLVSDEASALLIRLDAKGRLRVETRQLLLSADEARGRLDRVRALVVALDAAADAPPMLPLIKTGAATVSSSSGAPVGFSAR